MGRRKPNLRVLGLGDEKLLERLEKGAKAAGVKTVEELVDLVVDSGVSARPPKDPYTERFTLEDLGSRVWKLGATMQRNVRHRWFKKLAPVQKNAVVVVLRDRGYSSITIAQDLGIPQLNVEAIYAKHVTELGEQVLAVRLDTLAGSMLAAKERAQETAMLQRDAATFWRIEREFLAALQDLGVVQKAAHRVEVVNKAEEAKVAAFDRLVSLASKQAARRAELKQLEVEDAEPESLPQKVTVEYAELKDA